MDLIIIVGILFIFAIGLIVVGFVTRDRVSADVEERLERFGAHGHYEDEVERTDGNLVAEQVGRAVENRQVGKSMQQLLSRADIKMTVGEFMLLRFGTASAGAVIGFLAGRGYSEPLMGIIVGLVVGVLGWMAPHWYVSRKATQRARQFNEQLADTIGLMANSLRAGYSLLQTMELAARETPEPMSTEFKRVVREIGLGITPEQAMQHMLRRVPSEDLDLLVTAINIQHEVGGNLAKILDVMGETIRERVRIKGEVRVLTAQGQISGYVVTGLPVGITVIMFLISPDYLGELFVWPWICLPIIGVGMMVAGFFAMKKVVEIDV